MTLKEIKKAIISLSKEEFSVIRLWFDKFDAKHKDEQYRQIKLHNSAEKAMREAVKGVVLEHKKSGLALAVWKEGKVVNIPAKRLK